MFHLDVLFRLVIGIRNRSGGIGIKSKESKKQVHNYKSKSNRRAMEGLTDAHGVTVAEWQC